MRTKRQGCEKETEKEAGGARDRASLALTKTFALVCEIDLGRQIDVPAELLSRFLAYQELPNIVQTSPIPWTSSPFGLHLSFSPVKVYNAAGIVVARVRLHSDPSSCEQPSKCSFTRKYYICLYTLAKPHSNLQAPLYSIRSDYQVGGFRILRSSLSFLHLLTGATGLL